MTERARLAVRGAVQGVGFRPFVFRLAAELALDGWVQNTGPGVLIEVQGRRERLDAFLERLRSELPPNASLQSVETVFLDPVALEGFEIRASAAGDSTEAIVLPDLATCSDCLREIFDPADRRHRYPFTNCTNCGPRFTIVEELPYDRPRTTMKRFVMCPRCQLEYDDPRDRRFHAQPNACPECGPSLAWWDADGRELARREAALGAAVAALREGWIVAVHGMGGFHLMCVASDERVVGELRRRKHREEKPLAVMFAHLAALAAACEVSAAETRVLTSPQAPIVLLRRRAGAAASVAANVAPGNPSLGAMLPATPLHHLLLRDLGQPVVATSGNRSDEPICIDAHDAVRRLAGIADCFLVHDRPIARHVDDSVVRVLLDRELVLRRSRGYAPLPVPIASDVVAAEPVLAVGAHLKSTVALAVGANVFVSQHIGDLETPEALAAFREVIDSFTRLYRVSPRLLATDLHPDYLSTQHAVGAGGTRLAVQHHLAHVAGAMLENQLSGPVLGVAWDGTGLGTDGTSWGGEFLLTDGAEFRRVASLRPFRLPGGDAVAREPRRAALALLHACFGAALGERDDLEPMRAFGANERTVLLAALAKGVRSPLTTSAGRLFDAVASLTGIRQRSSFEGQAAMELEWACDADTTDRYTLPVVPWRGERSTDAPERMADWEPAVRALVDDLGRHVPAGVVAARFHAGMAEAIVDVARWIGEERVVLSGGCFQNRVLTERAVTRLRAEGFRPYWHQRVPPNDGGIALGQMAVALRRMRR
ncbi:MAG: carbamoyltransferase HypF [bacterium]